MDLQELYNEQITGIQDSIRSFNKTIESERAKNAQIEAQIQKLDQAIRAAERAKDTADSLASTASRFDYGSSWKDKSREGYEDEITGHGSSSSALGHDLSRSIQRLIDDMNGKKLELWQKKNLIAELIGGLQDGIYRAEQEIYNLRKQVSELIT